MAWSHPSLPLRRFRVIQTLSATVLLSSLALGATVSVSSPTSGATVTSPVQFTATASSPTCAKGISAMGIYTASGVLAYKVKGATINTALPLVPGAYRTVVQTWDNCGAAAAAPIKITVVASASSYPLTVALTGSGTVTSSPAGISCPGTCSATFPAGTLVNLTATPASGYSFSSWSGGGCGTGTSCSITLNAAASVSATFTAPGTPGSVTVSSPMSGATVLSPVQFTAASSSPGCAKGVSAMGIYTAPGVLAYKVSGANLSTALTLSPGTYNTVVQEWDGCGAAAKTPVQIVVVTTLPSYALTLQVTGKGTVTSSPAGISCPGTCSATFLAGTQINLTATAGTGYSFTNWTGGGCASGTSCALTLNAATSLTALFTSDITYPVAVSLSGAGPGTVTSSPAGINCGTSCSASFAPDGPVTLTATPGAGAVFSGWGGACTGTGSCVMSLSAAASVTAGFDPRDPLINVTTYHYDNARTGANTQEAVLTPSNVNSTQFGKLFSVPVQGFVFAHPLYMANVQNIAGGTHNVLFVATEHAILYAIDADNGTILWQQSFINPPDNTTVLSKEVSCGDLKPEIGITGTPVIDPSTGTIYLVTKTKELGVFFQRLHAIDIITHAEKFGGPVTISATVNGQTFDPLKNHNRPGLLLENGHIVIAWASHCDNGPYHGWVMSYKAGVQPTDTITQEAVFNGSPNGGLAGIWMAGDGVASDADGNLFFATGNGTYDGLTGGDFGDSIMKLAAPSSGAFPILDWFTPWNQINLSNADEDLGSGGLLLLPDLPAGSAHQHLLTQMGKEGKIYLLDRDNMGQFCSTCTTIDTQIVQEIPGATAGIWGSPAYWNGSVYWGGGSEMGSGSDFVRAFSFNANGSGLLSTSATSQSTMRFNYPTTTPVISADGNANGILWTLDNSSYGSTCCQLLYAFDATNLGTMLYSSAQAASSRDSLGGAIKFTSPMVANGKVYVGSQNQVSVFGLLNQGAAAAHTATAAPNSATPPKR
jgi:Divergent InlB B-repeat domain